MTNNFYSIYELTLTSSLVYYTYLDTTICSGDSIYWEGSYYYNTGIFQKNYPSDQDCDSIFKLSLSVNSLPVFSLGNDTTLSFGDSLSLFTHSDFSSYLWNDGDTNKYKTIVSTDYDTNWIFLRLLVTDINQCQNSDTIIISIEDKSSLTNKETYPHFVVYPNPTLGIVTLKMLNDIDASISISIKNLNGVVLLNETDIEGEYFKIDLSEF